MPPENIKKTSVVKDRTELEFLSNDLSNLIDKFEIQQEGFRESLSKLSSKFPHMYETEDKSHAGKESTPETFADTLAFQLCRLDTIHAKGQALLEVCREVIS